MQSNVLYCMMNPNSVVTVTGESIPNLKKGAYRDTETIIATTPGIDRYILSHNRSERIFEFKNGAKLEFISNLDEQSAKAGKRDRLFVDEADGVPYPIFFQLAIRTRGQSIIAYNPTAPFWAMEKLIGTTPESNDLSATIDFFRSDHRHNTFLSDEQHAQIEGIKDPDLWRVYARGLTGNLTGIIFTNWKQITPDKYPADDEKQFFGLDIGWTNDPTALVKIIRRGGSLFIKELAYKSGAIPAKHIKEILIANGYNQEQMVYCDHAPEVIRELRMIDVMAVPGRKGPGSINAGIEKLKEYDVYFVGENIEFERQRYMWVVDKDTGKPTNTPIDQYNHLIDSIRLAVMSAFWRQSE